MKKAMAFMLMLLMLCSIFSACAETPAGPEDTTAGSPEATTDAVTTATPEVTEITNSLPESLKFEGEKVVFVSRNADYVKDEITVELDDGDLVGSAIVRRNDAVENRFGITIENEQKSGGAYAVTRALQSAFNTSEHPYDIIANSCYSTIMYTGEGILYNLKKSEYIDFTAPYWSQGFNECASIGDGQYVVTGAPSLALYRLMFVTFFNRDLQNTLGGENLFDVVNSGRWTLDYQIKLAKDSYADNDSNGEVSEGDRVGFASARSLYVDSYWSSCQNSILVKDADNWFNYQVDVERLSATLDKVLSLYYDSGAFISAASDDAGKEGDIVKAFSEDLAVTATLRLGAAETEKIRSMSSKYGIIPMPKLNEQQENYYTFIHDQFTAFGICNPVNDERANMLSAVLEYMAYESYKTVVPVYYNIALKSRYMQDAESWNMLDRIYAGIYIDAGVLYTEKLQQVHMQPRFIVVDGINTTASRMKTMQKAVSSLLKVMKNEIVKLQTNGG